MAYAIFYLFFEAFPLVFIDIYHWGFGISGLAFSGILVGTIIAYVIYACESQRYLNTCRPILTTAFVSLPALLPPTEVGATRLA